MRLVGGTLESTLFLLAALLLLYFGNPDGCEYESGVGLMLIPIEGMGLIVQEGTSNQLTLISALNLEVVFADIGHKGHHYLMSSVTSRRFTANLVNCGILEAG